MKIWKYDPKPLPPQWIFRPFIFTSQLAKKTQGSFSPGSAHSPLEGILSLNQSLFFFLDLCLVSEFLLQQDKNLISGNRKIKQARKQTHKCLYFIRLSLSSHPHEHSPVKGVSTVGRRSGRITASSQQKNMKGAIPNFKFNFNFLMRRLKNSETACWLRQEWCLMASILRER